MEGPSLPLSGKLDSSWKNPQDQSSVGCTEDAVYKTVQHSLLYLQKYVYVKSLVLCMPWKREGVIE